MGDSPRKRQRNPFAALSYKRLALAPETRANASTVGASPVRKHGTTRDQAIARPHAREKRFAIWFIRFQHLKYAKIEKYTKNIQKYTKIYKIYTKYIQKYKQNIRRSDRACKQKMAQPLYRPDGSAHIALFIRTGARRGRNFTQRRLRGGPQPASPANITRGRHP